MFLKTNNEQWAVAEIGCQSSWSSDGGQVDVSKFASLELQIQHANSRISAALSLAIR